MKNRKVFFLWAILIVAFLSGIAFGANAVVEIPAGLLEADDIYVTRNENGKEIRILTLKESGVFSGFPGGALPAVNDSFIIFKWHNEMAHKSQVIQINDLGEVLLFSSKSSIRYRFRIKFSDFIRDLEAMYKKERRKLDSKIIPEEPR